MTPGLIGNFGLLGKDILTRIFYGKQVFTAKARTQAILANTIQDTGSSALTIRADVSLYAASYSRKTDGIIGEFGLVGPSVLEKLFPRNTAAWVSRSRTRYEILGPSRTDLVGPNNLLTLDWVQDAQPFAWAATFPPPLLTLDWAKDGQPFAANDLGADTGAGEIGFQIIADVSLTSDRAGGALEFTITADVSAAPTVVVNPAAFTITADVKILKATARIPKPCEFPGPVINLTCNLPFGVWQTNPNAVFTWWLVFVCAAHGDNQVPVDGYLYVLDKSPGTQPTWQNTRTRVPNASFNLSSVQYGTGSWWFHVAAYDYVGVGRAAHYNVKFDNVPAGPGGQFMWIDSTDTLLQRPLVAYAPPTPHQFTWNVSTDIDPRDVLSYELQIGTASDFALNRDSGITTIVLDAPNLPIASYYLTQTLAPGVYFWRIRASDGSRFSQWGPVGSFRVNNPPNAPYELSVYQTQ